MLLSTIQEHIEFLDDLVGVHPVAFQPSIPNLIYQYNFYVNYPETVLSVPNPEIAVEGKGDGKKGWSEKSRSSEDAQEAEAAPEAEVADTAAEE